MLPRHDDSPLVLLVEVVAEGPDIIYQISSSQSTLRFFASRAMRVYRRLRSISCDPFNPSMPMACMEGRERMEGMEGMEGNGGNGRNGGIHREQNINQSVQTYALKYEICARELH